MDIRVHIPIARFILVTAVIVGSGDVAHVSAQNAVPPDKQAFQSAWLKPITAPKPHVIFDPNFGMPVELYTEAVDPRQYEARLS